MRILIILGVILASILPTTLISACSRSTTETGTTTTAGISASTRPTTSGVKPSTATVGWVTTSAPPTTTLIPTFEADPFTLVSYKYELKEQDSEWWHYAYTVIIKNNTEHSLETNLTITFLDSDNNILAIEHQNDIALQPLTNSTVTGTTKVEAGIAWDLTDVSVEFN
jgi:hypothetical protein